MIGAARQLCFRQKKYYEYLLHLDIFYRGSILSFRYDTRTTSVSAAFCPPNYIFKKSGVLGSLTIVPTLFWRKIFFCFPNVLFNKTPAQFFLRHINTRRLIHVTAWKGKTLIYEYYETLKELKEQYRFYLAMLQTKIYRNMSKILYFQVSDMSPILAITSRSSFTLVSLNESMPWIRWESDLFFSFRNQPQHHLYRST